MAAVKFDTNDADLIPSLRLTVAVTYGVQHLSIVVLKCLDNSVVLA